eukprot:IDg7373t1
MLVSERSSRRAEDAALRQCKRKSMIAEGVFGGAVRRERFKLDAFCAYLHPLDRLEAHYENNVVVCSPAVAHVPQQAINALNCAHVSADIFSRSNSQASYYCMSYNCAIGLYKLDLLLATRRTS